VVEKAGGTYKPSVIIEAGKRFERMPVSTDSIWGFKPDSQRALRRASRVVFIEDCDKNHDGVISDQEQDACNDG
jgi:hypothetical protein